MLSWLRHIWRDQNGDLVQNLGWIVAVSLGAVAIGGLVYAGMKGSSNKIKSRMEGIDATVINPTY